MLSRKAPCKSFVCPPTGNTCRGHIELAKANPFDHLPLQLGPSCNILRSQKRGDVMGRASVSKPPSGYPYWPTMPDLICLFKFASITLLPIACVPTVAPSAVPTKFPSASSLAHSMSPHYTHMLGPHKFASIWLAVQCSTSALTENAAATPRTLF